MKQPSPTAQRVDRPSRRRHPARLLRTGDRGRGGFTIVELLVIAAIVSVLIVLLLPALAMARSTSRAVKCAANIRSLGQAIVVYSGDFANNVPFASMDLGATFPNASGMNYTWDDALTSYVGVQESYANLLNQWNPVRIPVFECPEDGYNRGTLLNGYQTRSYSIVESAQGYGAPYYALGMATRIFNNTTGWTPNANFRCFKIDEALAPSGTLLLVEKPMFVSAAVNILGHAGGALVDDANQETVGSAGVVALPTHPNLEYNYLFVDDHVNLYTPAQTVHAPATISTLPPNYMWTRDPND